ncbi:hypothetical protein WN944_024523 [Citrus x changshan-huyou]|uniref:Uncharacterized protein n=1 Tax=Citrus x changshan-huyou TaxID=2935761 RepID=A0AAP0QBC3_9ROSI
MGEGSKTTYSEVQDPKSTQQVTENNSGKGRAVVKLSYVGSGQLSGIGHLVEDRVGPKTSGLSHFQARREVAKDENNSK